MASLTDCMSKIPAECELFVVSSERTFGLAKSARDRWNQAILFVEESWTPDEQSPLDQVLDNECFKSLICALGVGIGGGPDHPNILDLTQIRYEKIFLATDDSPSGDQVCRQVLAFLHLHMSQVLRGRRVYTFETGPSATISEAEFEAQYLSPSNRVVRSLFAGGTLSETIAQL